MGWKAFVTGDPIDLRILLRLFPSDPARAGSVVFTQSDSGFQFTGPGLYTATTVSAANEYARQLLRRINGEAWLHAPEFRGVELTGQYEDGLRNLHVAIAGATAVMRVELTADGVVAGKNRPSPSRAIAPRQVDIAEHETNVAEVLETLSAPPPGWTELWKVYEIVRADVSARSNSDTMVTLGWATRDDKKRFGDAANNPGISGPAARHSTQYNHQPPLLPWMTIDEARAFIARLATAWLASLDRAPNH